MGNIIITYLPVLHRENQFFHSVLTCLQPWSCYWGSPNTLDVTENPMFKVDNYYSHCRGITLTVHSTLKLIYSVWVHKNIMQSVKHFVKQFTAINYFNNSQFLLDHSMTLPPGSYPASPRVGGWVEIFQSTDWVHTSCSSWSLNDTVRAGR